MEGLEIKGGGGWRWAHRRRRPADLARWPLALLACTALPGCIHLAADPGYAGPEPLPETVLAHFSYEARRQDATNTVLKQTKHYTIRRFALDPAVSLVGDHKITVDYYDLQGDTKTAVVLVLPILGGGNEIANHFARVFARNGFAALIVHRQESYKDTNDIEELNNIFRQIVLDHRQAVDWIESQPDLDAERIGLFGISAGAVKGALVCAVEKRIDAAVLALAGGDLPYILAHSREKGIAKRRERILAEQGITRRQLYEALKAEFRYDPLDYAKYTDAHRTLLILARFDSVIPYRCGTALREAMGKPETIILPTGHYGSILFLPVVEGAAISFFRKHLEGGMPSTVPNVGEGFIPSRKREPTNIRGQG